MTAPIVSAARRIGRMPADVALRLIAIAAILTLTVGFALAAALPATADEPTNTPPIANDDVFTTAYETAIVVQVCANDVDADGDDLDAVNLADFVGGTIPSSNGSTCEIEFAPAAGFTGSASFTYYAHDHTEQSVLPATVTIEVGEPPAVPTNTLPVLGDDTASTTVDTMVKILEVDLLANDSDADGDTLQVDNALATESPLAGEDWSTDSDGIRYWPPTGYTGTRTLRVIVSDGTGVTESLLTISITAVGNTAPTAVADEFTVAAGSTLAVGAPGLLANDTDAESSLEIADVSLAAHGSVFGLDATTGAFSYVPDAGFAGDDVFTYSAKDAGGLISSTVTVTIHVTEPTDPEPTDPEPTDPGSTDPEPVDPVAPNAGDGPAEEPDIIELAQGGSQTRAITGLASTGGGGVGAAAPLAVLVLVTAGAAVITAARSRRA